MVQAPATPDHMLEMSLEMVLNMHPLVCEHLQIKSASSTYNQVVEQVKKHCLNNRLYSRFKFYTRVLIQ